MPKLSLAFIAILLAACASAPILTPTPTIEEPTNVVDDLTFTSGDITLEGRLDLPEGDGPFPVIVWVHGSGRSTRTEAQRLTDLLNDTGFAVFRYDKRGVGRSGGSYEQISPGNSVEQLGLLAQDAAAAASFAASLPQAKGEPVGLFGSSQAGWIIPQAANLSSDVSFVCILVGPAVSVGMENRYSNLTNENSATLSDERLDELSEEMLAFDGTAGFDPAASIAAMQVPALWVLGGKDASIPTRETAAILEQIKAEGNKDFTIFIYPLGTHSLANVETGEQIPFMEELVLDWMQEAAKR
jgi:dienelactone hydrolase